LKIAFRVDASLAIGAGHVMRCLTLADALRERGAYCLFICRPHVGNLLELIQQRQHHVFILPELNIGELHNADDSTYGAWLGADWTIDAQDTYQVLEKDYFDWLVVDHYALDQRWEQFLRTKCGRIMVIDDLANRLHDCDLLLDQNLGRNADDYNSLLSSTSNLIIGPKYALLRPEFSQLRVSSLARRAVPKIQQLLISMGGVDKDNLTCQVLAALKISGMPSNIRVIVVMGSNAPWINKVREVSTSFDQPISVLMGVSEMAKIMAESDLAIGAAGTTSWERCCLGLPAIQMALAENQVQIAHALDNIGAALLVDMDSLFDTLHMIFSNQDAMEDLLAKSLIASAIVDGLGVWRVVNLMLGENYEDYAVV
jgi:UDP-2,4-diacetamido-2,4,6-trideoxy-beta-L-altropyranose hydrolase